MNKQCFFYCRVSGAAQVEGDGFDRQQLAMQEWADANGYQVARVFKEQVCGADEMANRPEFLNMLDALNGVTTIVVEAMHRLARDLITQEMIWREMQKRGITLVSATEPDVFDDTPTRKFIRQILGAVSELEKNQIVLKLRGARQRKKSATGRCEGQKPFGFYEQEGPALEEILRQRDALGLSAKRIAEGLNAGGFVPRRGKTWHPQVVVKILRANGRVV